VMVSLLLELWTRGRIAGLALDAWSV